MFGDHFYHERIRKAVSSFGALFNQLTVVRKGSGGNIVSSVRVPLAYGARDKTIQRIREIPDLNEDTKTAIRLPRMSFEITNYNIASDRMRSKITKRWHERDSDERFMLYKGIPYNIYFQLNIYGKTQEDVLQVVEQIVPYFAPQYTLTVKPFTDYPGIVEDNALVLQSMGFSDDVEGPQEQRRTIIYSLDFEMQVDFYGPIADSKIIREVETNFYVIGTDSDTLASRIVVTPDPLNAEPGDDYGFTETKTDFIDSDWITYG